MNFTFKLHEQLIIGSERRHVHSGIFKSRRDLKRLQTGETILRAMKVEFCLAVIKISTLTCLTLEASGKTAYKD